MSVPRPRRPRGGFTVVEVLVAVVVLSVGVLGLASSAGVIMRQMTDGAKQTQAAGIAQSRFDSLASVGYVAPTAGQNGCDLIAPLGGAVSGGRTARGVKESWTAKRAGASTVAVVDSVTLPRASKVLVFGSVVRCDR